jgi:hypothetical protein
VCLLLGGMFWGMHGWDVAREGKPSCGCGATALQAERDSAQSALPGLVVDELLGESLAPIVEDTAEGLSTPIVKDTAESLSPVANPCCYDPRVGLGHLPTPTVGCTGGKCLLGQGPFTDHVPDRVILLQSVPWLWG